MTPLLLQKVRVKGSTSGRHANIFCFVHREETCEQAAVLHYTYNRFEDLKSRRDRCDCAPTEDDAKRCFILPFDRSVSQAGQFSILVLYAF